MKPWERASAKYSGLEADMKTLSQERADFALKKVLEKTKEEKFATFSAGAPSVILQNGFGQAMAFWYAKANDKKGNKDEHKIMTDIIEEWSRKRFPGLFNEGDSRVFLENLMKMEQRDYHKVQNETIKLLEWVKRFANAFIKKADSQKGEIYGNASSKNID
jgi:CRISPR-associated protein Cmr5